MLDKKLFNTKTKHVTYTAKVWRIVESQETAATLNIVDNMEEQGLLEELLDNVKPPYRKGTEGMHYLIKTAFRYPPLKHGSRFGTRALPSFFYASEEIETALTETAYYRFLFLRDMDIPYNQFIDSRHSIFNVTVKTGHCLDLTQKTYTSKRKKLTDILDYSYCHAVGDWAVNNKDTEIIRFESARNLGFNNVAVAKPSAIRSKSPNGMRTWICRTSNERISFSSREQKFPFIFPIEKFLIDGVFPRIPV